MVWCTVWKFSYVFAEYCNWLGLRSAAYKTVEARGLLENLQLSEVLKGMQSVSLTAISCK